MNQENMVMSDENNPTLMTDKQTTVQGAANMKGRKMELDNRTNRRALSVINQNLGALPFKKSGTSQTNKMPSNNPPVPTHRPITRKFAAQMASLHQHQHEENKKPKVEAKELSIWEDRDEQENVGANGQHAPMVLEQTETDSTEKAQMVIGLDCIYDISEEAVLDIDSCDMNNPLAVNEYVEDLFAYYRKVEKSSCVSPGYMDQQFDINERMRAVLIDWLIEVHHKFELREETLFLTVNLIDRFLEKQTVVRKKLQLVGMVAMLLACKYEETAVPVVSDFIYISDKAYTRKEVLDMESLMLKTLQFNLSVPTPCVFMRRFLKAAESDKKLELLSFFLIELCLVEYAMLECSPSLLAAAAVYTAHCTLYGVRQWSKTCEWHTGYSHHQLLESSRMIVGIHKKAGTGKLTGVYRKYSTSKFGNAAKFVPAAHKECMQGI
ncbi:PREDICTED: G2/mitotic-specific cyclin-2-like [Ipomoea nil]|uniref:G2/mitotic-specific cyclin-2-like n=1 Tax=Ipomoea nil TaxID=35883 RepID=UPI000901D3D5|nr:PREDICTED: G2/mitotic-specific cyclin-2-like [Ipomoea nil]